MLARVIYLSLGLISISSITYSQSASKSTYLIVRMDGSWDYTRNRNFLKMSAEGGNPFAGDIYNLREYVSNKKAINTGASLYFEKNDTNSVFFNYFMNSTQALQFLADHDWELVTVTTEISSDYEEVREGDRNEPVTKVVSRPAFYMKKAIRSN